MSSSSINLGEKFEADPSMGFPHNGSMVIVKLSNVDQLIQEILDCKEKLKLLNGPRQGFFVHPEMLFILPVKVKTVIPTRGYHYYEVLEQATYLEECENKEYNFDWNLWVGDQVSPDNIFFTLQEAQYAVMDATAAEVSYAERNLKAAQAKLAKYEQEFGFKYEPKPDEA